MKREHQPGALLTIPPAKLSRTCALPASTTAIRSNPKNRPRRTAVRDKPVRLATCLDRSAAASGAIASTLPPCLPWRKLLSLAERLALARAAQRRAAHRAGASRRRGLSPSGDRERSKPVSCSEDRGEGLGGGGGRAVERQGRAEDDRGRAGRAPLGAWPARGGPSLAGAGSSRPLDWVWRGLGLSK